MKYLTKCDLDTIKLGTDFGKTLKGGDVVLLSGDLGAGKTTFTKGIALGLKIDDTITSPTFAISNVYEGQNVSLCHVDAYRLNNADEAVFAGLGEYLGDQNTVCVVEWHENISQILPKKGTVTVVIKYVSDSIREIEIVDKQTKGKAKKPC